MSKAHHLAILLLGPFILALVYLSLSVVHRSNPLWLTSVYLEAVHRPLAPLNNMSQQAIAEEYETERRAILAEKAYDQRAASTFKHPIAYNSSLSHPGYVDRLRTCVDEYFHASPYRSHLDEMLRRLDMHIPPPLLDEPIPKVVVSTCKGGDTQAWKPFARWRERLEPDGWEVYVADDDAMEDWFRHLTAGSGDEPKGLKAIWDSLPKPVLKTDLLRYLVVLLNGGIYTDSDTVPRAHPSIWGMDSVSLLPPNLSPLRNLLRWPAPHKVGPNPAPLFPVRLTDRGSSYDARYRGGINDPDVAVVISIEWDAVRRDAGDRLRPGSGAALGIVQWTLMAKPFHPILLDTVATVVQNVLSNDLDGSTSALDLTGPVPFGDAVLRYLLIQYGISQLDLVRATEPMKIGDILVLPEYSFSQYAPLDDEWDYQGLEPEKRCVGHGSLHRWKHDGWGR